MKKTYTLDRFDNFFGVFLLRSDESEQLLIPNGLIDNSIKEGDIVEIQKTEYSYDIALLRGGGGGGGGGGGKKEERSNK